MNALNAPPEKTTRNEHAMVLRAILNSILPPISGAGGDSAFFHAVNPEPK